MQLEHPPRITGSPSTPETKSLWNVSLQSQSHYQARNSIHFICSSSIYYVINDVCQNATCRGHGQAIVLQVLHAKPTTLFDSYKQHDCHEKHHVQVRTIAFNVTHSKCDDKFRYNKYIRYIMFWHPDRTSFKFDMLIHRNYEHVVHDKLPDAKLYFGASLVKNSPEYFIPVNVLGNTAFNYFDYYETERISPARWFLLKNGTRLCIQLLDNTIIETNNIGQRAVLAKLEIFTKSKESEDWRQVGRSAYRTNRFQDNTIIKHKPNHASLAENSSSIWARKTIREKSTPHFRKYEKHEVDGFSCRKFSRRRYGSLLLLYFLALPLLCSTYPATGIITSVSFVQKSSLAHTDNSTVHYLSPVVHHHSGGSRTDGQSHEEYPQGRGPVHPYNEYTWEVNQINPWLSACDLAGPAPADLQGSCGPPEVPKYCPMPCSLSVNPDRIFREVVERLIVPKKWRTGSAAKIQWNTFERTIKASAAPDQCLFYLEESHKRDICRKDFARSNPLSFSTSRENRYWFLSGVRLRHCCEYAVINALAPGDGGPLEDVLSGSPKCINALEKILSVDALAARLHCEFEEVLARYDCRQSYSVIHNCTHCKEAYRKWVCSSLVPYFAHEGPSISLNSVEVYVGTRLRPCRSFCQSVEQRCPYLLPGDRAPAYPTQYAGEPTFLCRDPNIPETGGQAVRALHGDEAEECCFRVCSENEPGSGVCANCTDNEPHGRRIGRDPPSAPHCERMSVIQSTLADPQNIAGNNPELSVPPSTKSASASFCVNGGTDAMSSSSPSSYNTTSLRVSVSLVCFLWIWAALISLCTDPIIFLLSPVPVTGFISNSSSWLMRIKTVSIETSRIIQQKPLIIKSIGMTQEAQS